MSKQRFPTRGKVSLRRGRSSEPGQIYLVTFTTLNRRPLFNTWSAAHAFSKCLIDPMLWRASRLHCWVLMPDHWHGLVEVGPADYLSMLVGRIKCRTARLVNQECNESGNLWGDGFHDHALRKEEDMLNIARYIILNPVRAGIVQRVGQYPFWDAVWLYEKHSTS